MNWVKTHPAFSRDGAINEKLLWANGKWGICIAGKVKGNQTMDYITLYLNNNRDAWWWDECMTSLWGHWEITQEGEGLAEWKYSKDGKKIPKYILKKLFYFSKIKRLL